MLIFAVNFAAGPSQPQTRDFDNQSFVLVSSLIDGLTLLFRKRYRRLREFTAKNVSSINRHIGQHKIHR
jgi:hypothetical protein